MSPTQFNYHSVVLNASALYESNRRFKNWLKIRKNKYLDESEKFEINQFTNKRFSGDDKSFLQYGYFEKENAAIDLLNIDRKNVIFSCFQMFIGMLV